MAWSGCPSAHLLCLFAQLMPNSDEEETSGVKCITGFVPEMWIGFVYHRLQLLIHKLVACWCEM